MNDECEHKNEEDCIICNQCGRCREDVDSEDVCTECKQEVLHDLLKLQDNVNLV